MCGDFVCVWQRYRVLNSRIIDWRKVYATKPGKFHSDCTNFRITRPDCSIKSHAFGGVGIGVHVDSMMYVTPYPIEANPEENVLKLAAVFLEGEATVGVWGPGASVDSQATVLYSTQKTSTLRVTTPIEICVYGTTVTKDDKRASVFISKLMQLITYGINNAENLGLSIAQARGPGSYPFRIPSHAIPFVSLLIMLC